jgi:hypothetical protein
MAKTLILVLSADIPKYQQMIKTMKKTWASYKSPNFETKFYYGTSSKYRAPYGQVRQEGDTIVCGIPEGMNSILNKTIMTYEYVLNHYSFDYIFRCCAASYIIPKNLIRYLKDKPRQRFYCGAIGKFGHLPFASGSGYFLSRDLVKLIIKNKRRLQSYGHAPYLDDVIVGRFLKENGIKVTNGIRVNLDRCPRKKDIKIGCYHYHFPVDPKCMIMLSQLLK